ncbi:MAG: hypothetical protein ACR2OI_04350 [Acidimicrobiia bacterium]
MVTVLALICLVAGVGVIGVGQRVAPSHPAGPQILGAGVVLFFGGVALISFRSGDRAPVMILGTMAILLVVFSVVAFRRH